MEKQHSVWNFLGRGIVWGGLVVVVTTPVYLVLFILANNIGSLSYGLGFDPVVFGISDMLVVMFYYGFRILAVPSILGGGILGLVLYGLIRRYHRVGRLGLWIGIAVGSAVALRHMLYWVSVNGGPWWTFDILIYLMEMAAFGWLGQHLIFSHRNVR